MGSRGATRKIFSHLNVSTVLIQRGPQFMFRRLELRLETLLGGVKS